MEPFDLLDYEEPGRLDRVLGLAPKRNAYVELHNLIAAARGPEAFGPDDLGRIGRRHGVDLREAFFAERRALYAAYLDHCLDLGRFGDAERTTLGHLARTLFLDPADLRPVHERAFGHTVSGALTDDCLSVEERLLLYTLQHTLGLDPAEAELVYEAEARTRLLATVARALCDGALSPNEAGEIEALEAELGVRVPARVEALLDRAAHRWRLRHGPLPSVEVGIRLLPGEVGHYHAAGRWRAVRYARLRVLLGDHRAQLHQSHTADLSIPEDALTGRVWHKGRFVVTNQRLVLLRNGKKLQPHPLASVAGIERYANGVRVAIRGGRSFLLDAGPATPMVFALLWRVLYPGRPRPEAGGLTESRARGRRLRAHSAGRR